MSEISSGMYIIDPDYTVVGFNQTAAVMYPQLEVGEACYRSLVGLDTPCPACPVSNGVKGPHYYFDPIRKIGETVDAVDMPLPDGRLGHALIFSTVDEEGEYRSERDQQTGLLNREGLLRYCETHSLKASDARIVAIAADIANYGVLISQRGDAVADRAVSYIAESLKPTGAVLAYVGGGRFLGILELGPGRTVVPDEQLLRRIENGSPVRDLRLRAGVFDGFASDGSLATLVRCAEATLNGVRHEPRKTCKVVNMQAYEQIVAENQLLASIVDAIDAGEFDIYLQPKCRLSDGCLAGSEALARWIRPDGSVVPPCEFIPILERSGEVTKLDLYVWELVFKTIREWVDQHLDPLPVSLNVSRVDISELDVPAEFVRLAKKHDVAPGLVEVEITESAYIQDDGHIRQTVEGLRSAGFHVLVDDFGSGYSSLSMLRDIDADILKLDMGFLDVAGEADTRTADIVSSVLEMAHQLDMCVIVEGVETLEQAEMLSLLGCQLVQGYYFYRPMPRDQFAQLAASVARAPIPADSFRPRGKSNLQRLSECFYWVGEYNLVTGDYRFFRNYPEPDFATVPRPATLYEHGRRYADHGLIHPDDIQGYLAFLDVEHAREGLMSSKGSIRILFRLLDTGNYKWFAFEMRKPFDFDLGSNPWVIITWKEAAENEVDSMVAMPPLPLLSKDEELEPLDASAKPLVFGPRVVLESLPGGYFVHEATGELRILYANTELARIFGCNSLEELRELTGGTLRGVIHSEDFDLSAGVFARQLESSRKIGGQPLSYVSHRIVKRDGSIAWVQGYGRLLEHSVYGQVFAVFISEVADARMDVFKIAARMGSSDILCDVLNRNSFEQRKGHLAAYSGGRAACVFMDANDLHQINNDEGHDAGDEFLIAIANALKAQFGEEDVFRVGGDEFVVICRDLPESEVQKKMAASAASVEGLGRSVACGYSYVEDLKDPDALIAAADERMRAAKSVYHAQRGTLPRYSLS